MLRARLHSDSEGGWKGSGKKTDGVRVVEVFDGEKEIHDLDWEDFCRGRESLSL